MDNQELLIRPASTLTRKQRKERAALKKSIAREMKLPPGKALGRFRIPYPRVVEPERWGQRITIRGLD